MPTDVAASGTDGPYSASDTVTGAAAAFDDLEPKPLGVAALAALRAPRVPRLPPMDPPAKVAAAELYRDHGRGGGDIELTQEPSRVLEEEGRDPHDMSLVEATAPATSAANRYARATSPNPSAGSERDSSVKAATPRDSGAASVPSSPLAGAPPATPGRWMAASPVRLSEPSLSPQMSLRTPSRGGAVRAQPQSAGASPSSARLSIQLHASLAHSSATTEPPRPLGLVADEEPPSMPSFLQTAAAHLATPRSARRIPRHPLAATGPRELAMPGSLLEAPDAGINSDAALSPRPRAVSPVQLLPLAASDEPPIVESSEGALSSLPQTCVDAEPATSSISSTEAAAMMPVPAAARASSERTEARSVRPEPLSIDSLGATGPEDHVDFVEPPLPEPSPQPPVSAAARDAAARHASALPATDILPRASGAAIFTTARAARPLSRAPLFSNASAYPLLASHGGVTGGGGGAARLPWDARYDGIPLQRLAAWGGSPAPLVSALPGTSVRAAASASIVLSQNDTVGDETGAASFEPQSRAHAAASLQSRWRLPLDDSEGEPVAADMSEQPATRTNPLLEPADLRSTVDASRRVQGTAAVSASRPSVSAAGPRFVPRAAIGGPPAHSPQLRLPWHVQGELAVLTQWAGGSAAAGGLARPVTVGAGVRSGRRRPAAASAVHDPGDSAGARLRSLNSNDTTQAAPPSWTGSGDDM